MALNPADTIGVVTLAIVILILTSIIGARVNDIQGRILLKQANINRRELGLGG